MKQFYDGSVGAQFLAPERQTMSNQSSSPDIKEALAELYKFCANYIEIRLDSRPMRNARAALDACNGDGAARTSMRADILDALDWLEHSAKIKDNPFHVPEIIKHNEMATAQAERIRLALFSRDAAQPSKEDK